MTSGLQRAADAYAADAWGDPIPFQLVNVPAFPTSVLPGWVRDFVDELAVATQTPADLPGVLALAALSATVSDKIRVEVRPGWTEPANLFVVVILPPGNRKSAVFADIARPIQDFEAAERERLAPIVNAQRTEWAVKKNALKKIEAKAANLDDLQAAQDELERAKDMARDFYGMPEPRLPQLLTADCTPERLGTLLWEQGGRMSVFSAEGDVFEIMGGRYSKNSAPNFDVYLKSHAGDPLYIDRQGRERLDVRHPCLTVALAVQPDVVRHLANKPGFRGRGLIGRFLYALPEPLLGRRAIDAPPVSLDTHQDWHDGLTYLLQLWKDGTEGDREPHQLTMDADARDVFLQFERAIEPELGPDGRYGSMTDWAGKLVGAAARLGGLLHVATMRTRFPDWITAIDGDTARAAVTLAEYFAEHATATLYEMGADPAVEDARAMLRHIAGHDVDEFSRRDLFNWCKGSTRFAKVQDLDAGITMLERHNWIRPLVVADVKRRGRPPGQRWTVNPNLGEQYSQNPQKDIGRREGAVRGG